MTYFTRASGKFRIEPPLTWPEFKDSPYRPERESSEPDVQLDIDTVEVDGEHGVMLLHRAVAVRPFAPGMPFAYHTGLYETLGKLVAEYGERHRFTGFFECRTTDDRGFEGWYRLSIRDGEVVRTTPTVTWPDEENPS